MVFWEAAESWVSCRRSAGWTRGSYYRIIIDGCRERELERKRTPRTRVSWKSATVCMLFSGIAGGETRWKEERRGKGTLTKPESCGRLYRLLSHWTFASAVVGSADLELNQLIDVSDLDFHVMWSQMAYVDLTPTPGFCVKSSVLNPEPSPVPAGRKVFINICYDRNVPPPPPADDQTITQALSAHQRGTEDSYYVPVVVSQPREDKDKGWFCSPRTRLASSVGTGFSSFISLIFADQHLAWLFLTAGNPALVFDCIYNQTVKARVLSNSEYKLFIVGELLLFFSIGCSESPRVESNGTQRQPISASLLLSKL